MTKGGSHAEDELMPVRVIALLEEPTMNSPVVVLYEPEDNRIFPIWIGEPEARAIAMAFQNVEVTRPLTHMLIGNVIHEMGGHVLYVAIEQLDAATYYATIAIDVGNKKPLMLDARPSDSIAVALDMEVPIFVARSVLDVAAQDNPFPADPETGMPSVQLEALVDVSRKDSKKTKAKFHPPSKAKTQFDEDEVARLKTLLEKAREKEQGEGGSK